MSRNPFDTGVVVLVVALIPSFLGLLLFRYDSRADRGEALKDQHSYRPHPLIIWLSAGSTAFVAALFIAIVILIPRHGAAPILIFGGAAAGFLILGWFSTRKLQTADVVLGADTIEFKYGRRVKAARFADIWAVHFRMGYITALTAPRKVALLIPPMFKNSGDLFRRLNAAVTVAHSSKVANT